MKSFYVALSIFTLSFCAANSAHADFEFKPFTTLEQAQKNCPSEKALTFMANHPTLPNSAGTIIGNNRVPFESIPAREVLKPKNLDANGVIQDARFRNAEGIYGYISNNVVTCLYSYETFTGGKYHLAVRSK